MIADNTDPSMLTSTNQPPYERHKNDLYNTPMNVTEALCRFLHTIKRINNMRAWEPAAGNHYMAYILKQHFQHVFTSDIEPTRITDPKINFITTDNTLPPPSPLEAIITNPPYNQIDAFIDRALDYLKTTTSITLVAILARNEYDSASRRTSFFKDNPFFAYKLPLLWRPRWIENTTTGPRHNYAWFVWQKFNTTQHRPSLIYLDKPCPSPTPS